MMICKHKGLYKRISGLSRLLLLYFLYFVFLVPVSPAFDRLTVQHAIELIEKQSYVEAISLLHELEESLLSSNHLDALFAAAYLGHGYQLLASNDFEASRESFERGRVYAEDDIRLWQGEAMVFYKEGRYDEASSLLNQALAFNADNASLYYLLGRSYYAGGRMPEALDALNKAREMSKDEEVLSLLQKVEREWQVEQEMAQEYRGHFQLSFVDGGNSSTLAADVLAVLEDAYAELGADLNFYPDVKVPVLLYSQTEYAAVTDSPDWSGGLYDGKIRLPVAGVQGMTEPLRALLYHEYMHVLVRFLANGNAPVWLNEGLAEVAGRRFFTPEHSYLSQSVKKKELVDWQTMSQPFVTMETARAILAYEQSYSLTSYMIDRYGWFKIAELLRSLANGQRWQAAISAVYADYGLDWPAIQREWQASLL